MTKSAIQPRAIRLTVTPEVKRALAQAKRQYPTLSDPEILKLGLAKMTTSDKLSADRAEIDQLAANALGYDYLSDPEEDIYTTDMGTKVNFE
jgi:hypothetical protein